MVECFMEKTCDICGTKIGTTQCVRERNDWVADPSKSETDDYFESDEIFVVAGGVEALFAANRTGAMMDVCKECHKEIQGLLTKLRCKGCIL